MSTNKQEVNLAGANGVEAAPGLGDNFDLTVQQEAYLLHMLHVETLRNKIEKEMAELHMRQDKIKAIHDIMQDINNAMDEEGNLDLNKHPELREKFQKLKEHGLKIPEKDQNNIQKEKFNMHESRRILENCQYKIDDWGKEDNLQMRKIQNYFTESEQSIMIAKHTMQAIDKPARAMISGIKGG